MNPLNHGNSLKTRRHSSLTTSWTVFTVRTKGPLIFFEETVVLTLYRIDPFYFFKLVEETGQWSYL